MSHLSLTLPYANRLSFARASKMLEACGGGQDIQALVLPGNPPSKNRIHGSEWSRNGQQALARALASWSPYPANVAVACIFGRQNHHRVDVDNLLKLVLDAGTQSGVWRDDSQVTAVIATLEWAAVEPFTVVAMASHESSLPRGEARWPACRRCGVVFKPIRTERFCSAECRRDYTLTCPKCGIVFQPTGTHQIYCTRRCRDGVRRTRRCGSVRDV